MANDAKDLKWISAFGIFGTGIAGGFIWGLFYIADINLSTGQSPEIKMSYAELAAVMLAAATLMITALGVMIAVIALVGRRQIKNDSHTIAEGTANARIKDILGEDGKPSDLLRSILIERVDEILLNGPKIRAGENEVGVNDDNVWGDESSEYGDDK